MRTNDFARLHITGEGFRTVAVYRLFFKAALRDVRKRIADYEAEVAEWYESGPGAKPDWRTESDEDGRTWQWNAGGQGHRFPHCIHGTDLTTDYDNICFGCEESETVVEQARLHGRERYLRFNARWEWVHDTPGDLDETTRRQLLEWAISIFPKED